MKQDQASEEDPVICPTSYPTGFQKKTFWGALTASSIVVIGVIAVGLIWLATKILSFLQPLLVPLAVAGIIAYLLEPVIRLLTRNGMKRFKAVLVVFTSFNLTALVLFTIIIFAGKDYVSNQTKLTDLFDESITSLETAVERAKTRLTSLAGEEESSGAEASPPEKEEPAPADVEPSPAEAPAPENPEIQPDSRKVSENGQSELSGNKPSPWKTVINWLSEIYPSLMAKGWAFATRSVHGMFGFFGYILGLVLVPIYLYYFLKESESIANGWSHYLPLKASAFKDEVVDTITEINGYLIAFFRGQMLVSIIDGILIAICLSILGLPFAILIGIFVAILGLIPYIGNLLCLIPAVLISIAHFKVQANQFWGIEQVWVYPVIVGAIFFIVQQINGLATAPKIVGDSVGLHPLTVIFSVLFWSFLLGGLLGSLLAVPLTASLKVLFRRYIWERKLHPEWIEMGEEDADPSPS
ncbi:MAG: AI-2E family transporter [Verrucomicrobiota bacterium]